MNSQEPAADPKSVQAANQRLAEAYQKGRLVILVQAMTATQQQQFGRTIILQANNECMRVLPVLEQRQDQCATEAMAKAMAWIETGAWPSDSIQRRFDDFYNPFWIHNTTSSSNEYECATAVAYCTERAVQAAYQAEWFSACREVTMVVDMVAQALHMDREIARTRAERWYLEAAWALLQE